MSELLAESRNGSTRRAARRGHLLAGSRSRHGFYERQRPRLLAGCRTLDAVRLEGSFTRAGAEACAPHEGADREGQKKVAEEQKGLCQ